MTKFSEGPWSYEVKENACVIENKDETYIADVHFWTEGAEKVTLANAALISAGPEMYEALNIAEEVLNSLIEADRFSSYEDNKIYYALSFIEKALMKARTND